MTCTTPSIVDIKTGTVGHKPVGRVPDRHGMTPDSKKAYMSNFLGHERVLRLQRRRPPASPTTAVRSDYKKIDLWENYDPIRPARGGAWGGLTIQLPVSPDGKACWRRTPCPRRSRDRPEDEQGDQGWLPCNAGCHGANFGAKKGGGYYAYVSNKFSNAMQVIDIDPNNDGDISDAAIAGQLVLGPTSRHHDGRRARRLPRSWVARASWPSRWSTTAGHRRSRRPGERG